ncbi:hypothetical protein D9M71_779470 [compost metagenome]
MAQVQVGRGRVEAGLHTQRAAAFQTLAQFIRLEDLIGATADQGKGFINRGHAKNSRLRRQKHEWC